MFIPIRSSQKGYRTHGGDQAKNNDIQPLNPIYIDQDQKRGQMHVWFHTK